jgi:mannose-6-phosphate isomerase-like protein (cupin superfamily)
MRHSSVLCAFLLLSCLAAAAQVWPTSSNRCSIDASGLMQCMGLSTPGVMFPHADTSKPPKAPDKGVFVTRFVLSPGALLHRMQARDVLIISMGDGDLVNEAKESETHINVTNGMVMLMPKGESYLLRNVGNQDLDLLIIDVKQ